MTIPKIKKKKLLKSTFTSKSVYLVCGYFSHFGSRCTRSREKLVDK